MGRMIDADAAIDALNTQAEEMSHWSERYQEQRRGVLTAVNIVTDCLSAQPESEAISKWKKEFREYVDSLDIARDDWKGIIEYIDELPSIQSYVIRCKDYVNYIDHRCVVADHHVAPFSCCQDVFNARRRGEQE